METEETADLKTCYVSAPAGADLAALWNALQSRRLRVLVPDGLAIGTDWASEGRRLMSQVDLVIGVLTSDRWSSWVLFELGQASALGRRIMLIAVPEAGPIPFALRHVLVLRIDLTNQEAIGFALDQVLSASGRPTEDRVMRPEGLTNLGTRADGLMVALDRSIADNDEHSTVEVVAEAIRYSGADIVAVSPSGDKGVDVAVWCDALEPLVGNPLLVEVKTRIRDENEADRATQQLVSYLGESGTRWALLLYDDCGDLEHQVWPASYPSVLTLSLRSLVKSLRTQAFPELIRDLRNRRVHGVS